MEKVTVATLAIRVDELEAQTSNLNARMTIVETPKIKRVYRAARERIAKLTARVPDVRIWRTKVGFYPA